MTIEFKIKGLRLLGAMKQDVSKYIFTCNLFPMTVATIKITIASILFILHDQS